ncbi:MAG: hypothetical protein JW941_06110, partial [Candidatus Coatesbacteria bacterium]|nr:hypothetical protein [Candidatus Coatesbacteria bacterium]
MTAQNQSVLFVCSGNICRSPFAAVMLEKKLWALGLDDVLVESAGTMDLEPRRASRLALEVADEKGLDLSHHLSRHVDRTMLEDAGIVIAMTKAHAEYLEALMPGVSEKTIVLEVPDPYGLQKETYRVAFQVIEDAMPMIIDEV